MLPMALAGGSAVDNFAIAMVFGIVVGASSSIFIAAPILLILGEGRLRPKRQAIDGASKPHCPEEAKNTDSNDLTLCLRDGSRPGSADIGVFAGATSWR